MADKKETPNDNVIMVNAKGTEYSVRACNVSMFEKQGMKVKK